MSKLVLQLIIVIIVVLSVILSGCNEFGNNEDDNNNNYDGDINQPEDCPTPGEVDMLEQDFLSMRDELITYLNDTELKQSPYSTTLQQGNLTDEGREMRLEYEEFREEYIDTANNACFKTDGTYLEGGHAIWFKGNDLIEGEIHPEYFLGLPIWSKKRYIYEEPNFWSGETTEYAEYKYYAEVDGYRVVALIHASDVGTVENQWQELARNEGFETATYESGEPVGSTVYYTNYYENEYEQKYKGIYFQIFGFKVYAGYYSRTAHLGTEPDYFNEIVFTEDDAKELYEYLVYTSR